MLNYKINFYSCGNRKFQWLQQMFQWFVGSGNLSSPQISDSSNGGKIARRTTHGDNSSLVLEPTGIPVCFKTETNFVTKSIFVQFDKNHEFISMSAKNYFSNLKHIIKYWVE